jgi:hypothetical protein
MDEMPRDEIDIIGDRIAETAASTIRWFDLGKGWERQGLQSCAHWLSWRCGVALGAAREKVRVAHALAELPEIDEALRLGQISYSKVRAMTRVAVKRNEHQICRLAGQLEPGPDGAPKGPDRWVHVRDTDDAIARIEMQLRPEEAARVLKACDVSAET